MKKTDEQVKEVSLEEAEAEPKRRHKKRLKMNDVTLENDIKYRGPFSYRHLRIFGWLFFALSQIGVILTIGGKANEYMAANIQGWTIIFDIFGEMMMPLFLLANFAFILRGHANFKQLIIKYGAFTLGFAAVYYLIYEHYIVGFFGIFVGDREAARSLLDILFTSISGSGMKTLNVFLDLLLCTLFYFFLVYQPKKYFQGKKIIIFRLFAILPVLYEAVSLTFKFLGAAEVLPISPYAYPFLTCKPPMTFVAFMVIALFFAFRKNRYFKKGGTEKQYQTYLKTNADSWQVSKTITFTFLAAAIVDLLIVIVILLVGVGRAKALGPEVSDEVLLIVAIQGVYYASELGFGAALSLILVVPFALLFSYTKVHKDKKLDMIIPAAGIGLVAFIYLEGMFQLSKNIPDLIQKLIDKILGGGGGE